MEGMLMVGASADRRELVEVLLLELLAVPMMLFWCYDQYRILFRLEFSFLPSQVVMLYLQLLVLQRQLEHLHELVWPRHPQQLLVLLLLVVFEFLLLAQLGFWILPLLFQDFFVLVLRAFFVFELSLLLPVSHAPLFSFA